MTRVTILAGGVGGSKMAHGLALAGVDLTVIGNVADDLEVSGLYVSPDLDTVMYTLAGLANPDTGWGLRDETWSGAEMLERYGAPTWFRLGDRDLATHVVRSERLRAGQRLTDVTAHLASSLRVPARLLPATDDRVRTQVRTDDGWLDFQEYFVERRHQDEVRELRYDGLESAVPSAEVLAAVGQDAQSRGDVLLLAPSNPFLSIAPILGVAGLADAVRSAAAPVVAVSPIVAGKAVRGPADRLFVSLGGEASALGVARHYHERYPGVLDALVIDSADAALAEPIEALGIDVLVTDTVMRTEEDRRRLAEEVLAFASGLSGAGDASG